MAHDVRNPHIFVDGPGNTASGDQVMDNFDANWAESDRHANAWKNTGFKAVAQFVGQGAATFIMPGGSSPSVSTISLPSVNGTSAFTFDLDPADYAETGHTTKMRIRWHLIGNGVATAQSFTPGLYPITGYTSPGAGLFAGVTFGTVVAGSTAVFTTPAASADLTTLSSEFNAPSAGKYAFGLVNTGNMAANSGLTMFGALQYRLL